MNKPLLTLSVAIGVALAGMVHAAEIIPVNFDGPGEGYNDPNAAAAVAERRKFDAKEKAELETIQTELWANLREDHKWLRNWEYV